jgi:hypothetical protein
MPKKPPSHKQGFRNSGPPRSTAELLASLARRTGIDADRSEGPAPRAGKAVIPDKNAALDPVTQLRNRLPAELAPHLREVRIRDGILIVYAESAAWGARLRLWLMEWGATNPAPLLPSLAPNARVLARVMPAGGYRR